MGVGVIWPAFVCRWSWFLQRRRLKSCSRVSQNSVSVKRTKDRRKWLASPKRVRISELSFATRRWTLTDNESFWHEDGYFSWREGTFHHQTVEIRENFWRWLNSTGCDSSTKTPVLSGKIHQDTIIALFCQMLASNHMRAKLFRKEQLLHSRERNVTESQSQCFLGARFLPNYILMTEESVLANQKGIADLTLDGCTQKLLLRRFHSKSALVSWKEPSEHKTYIYIQAKVNVSVWKDDRKKRVSFYVFSFPFAFSSLGTCRLNQLSLSRQNTVEAKQ